MSNTRENYRPASKPLVQFNPKALEYEPQVFAKPIVLANLTYAAPSASNTLPPSKALSSLETSEALRDKLEFGIRKAKVDRRTAEAQLAIANAERTIMRRDIQEMMDDAETARMYTEDLRQRFEEVVRQNEKLVAEAETAKLKKDQYAIKIKDLEQEAKLRGDRYSVKTQELKDQNIRLEMKMENMQELKRKMERMETKTDEVEQLKEGINIMQTNVAKLETELQVKDPLFQVGVDIRTRFLAEAKMSLWHVKTWDKISGEYFLKKHTVDSAIIARGYKAAHGGNGMADGSLFVLNKLSREWATKETKCDSACPSANDGEVPDTAGSDETAFEHGLEALKPEKTNIFEELYHFRPCLYATMPSKMLEAIDYEATIKTLILFNEGLDRPLAQKHQALDIIGTVLRKYPGLPREHFDTDADVLSRVNRVKALTEMIILYDRRRTGKTRGARRSGSSYQSSGESLI
ncbi:uncharacterized protein RAG0_13712 [Rhynchosporium agropyri]|uniref:Uncharacterized protein n=1 Tax=Rhynchosporium agropyri TaxID=914238 RepID=A0A1E1LE34_9HELO|nr:uncharacterized protein RAG0_13712 [Rhynchosporium agropyri]